MNLTIQVQRDDGTSALLSKIKRSPQIEAGSLGLILGEAKALLSALQQMLVTHQVNAHVARVRECSHCNKKRQIKDYHSATFKSLFGGVPVCVSRWHRCKCTKMGLLTETVTTAGLAHGVSPELEYVQCRLSACLPCARTAELLGLLLPVSAGNATSTVRRRMLGVGTRLEAELYCANTLPEISESKPRNRNTTVIRLDSDYVRHCHPHLERAFELVLGKILCSKIQSRSLGFVRSLESNDAVRHRLRQRMAKLSCNEVHTKRLVRPDFRQRPPRYPIVRP